MNVAHAIQLDNVSVVNYVMYVSMPYVLVWCIFVHVVFEEVSEKVRGSNMR